MRSLVATGTAVVLASTTLALASPAVAAGLPPITGLTVQTTLTFSMSDYDNVTVEWDPVPGAARYDLATHATYENAMNQIPGAAWEAGGRQVLEFAAADVCDANGCAYSGRVTDVRSTDWLSVLAWDSTAPTANSESSLAATKMLPPDTTPGALGFALQPSWENTDLRSPWVGSRVFYASTWNDDQTEFAPYAEISLDNGASWRPASGFIDSNQPTTQHIRLRTFDEAGNKSDIDAGTLAWRVDTTAPTMTLKLPKKKARVHSKSWRALTGHVDDNRRVDRLYVKFVQKRGSFFWASRGGKNWSKAGKTLQSALSLPTEAYPSVANVQSQPGFDFRFPVDGKTTGFTKDELWVTWFVVDRTKLRSTPKTIKVTLVD